MLEVNQGMSTRIMHIDMDAFFASVEQQVNPSLRGKPVIIGGRNNKYRSIICAASYEAKALGINNAMPSWKALQICPQAIFVAADTSKYIYTSDEIFSLLKSFSPRIEKFSIDEFFLDLNSSDWPALDPECIAFEIKKMIKQRFGLTCSIGIAPTKITAKLAAKLNKPDGFCMMTKQEALIKLKYLPVEKICGIGPRLKRRFNLLGIQTCGQLTKFPDYVLKEHFGVIGLWLKKACLVEDFSDIRFCEEYPLPPKSVGHSQTLKESSDDRAFINEWIYLLSEMTAQRLRKKCLQGKTVYCYMADGFTGGVSKQKTYYDATYDGYEIYQRCLEIINLARLSNFSVRVLGVSVSGLSEANGLYLYEDMNRRERLMKNIDLINEKHGPWTIFPASLKRAAY